MSIQLSDTALTAAYQGFYSPALAWEPAAETIPLSEEYKKLCIYLKAKGLAEPDIKDAYKKGWRKSHLEAFENDLIGFAKKLPRVEKQVVYVSSPGNMVPASFSMKKFFTGEKNSQLFEINLACDIKGIKSDLFRKIAQHEALHALQVNFIIDHYKKDVYIRQWGGVVLSSKLFDQHQIDYVIEVLKEKKLNSPFGPEEFESVIKDFSNYGDWREKVCEKLAEIIVWANCDKQDFKAALSYSFALTLKDLNGRDHLDIRVLSLYMVTAAFYVVLFEKYGMTEDSNKIKELFSGSKERDKGFKKLYAIFLTQWMAAEAKPLKFDKAN